MGVNTGLFQAYADAAEWHPVKSSNVEAVAYLKDFAYMFVRFKAKGKSAGSLYVYRQVEPGVFQGLLAAPSKGEYLARIIKPHYFDYDKIG